MNKQCLKRPKILVRSGKFILSYFPYFTFFYVFKGHFSYQTNKMHMSRGKYWRENGHKEICEKEKITSLLFLLTTKTKRKKKIASMDEDWNR